MYSFVQIFTGIHQVVQFFLVPLGWLFLGVEIYVLPYL